MSQIAVKYTEAGYFHHGVLMPNQTVIHLLPLPLSTSNASSSSTCSSFFGSGRVTRTSLDIFRTTLNSGRKVAVYKVKYASKSYNEVDVIQRAERYLNKVVTFSLFFHNCESFARWCVTGVPLSSQALRTVRPIRWLFIGIANEILIKLTKIDQEQLELLELEDESTSNDTEKNRDD